MSIATYFLLAGKGFLKFCLKHWVWFALVAALLVARHMGVQSAEHAEALRIATNERDTAVATAKAWEKHAADSLRLAEATATARAEERADLLSIARALGSTKHGIANAPGASDAFRYSDSVYGFMRQRAPEQPSAQAAPHVDDR